jgi:hypothetical protein
MQQPFSFGAEPQAAVAGSQNAESAVVREAGAIPGLQRVNKPGAIESHQAPGRPDPEITVAGLLDRLDSLFRQSILNVPDAPGIRWWRFCLRPGSWLFK